MRAWRHCPSHLQQNAVQALMRNRQNKTAPEGGEYDGVVASSVSIKTSCCLLRDLQASGSTGR